MVSQAAQADPSDDKKIPEPEVKSSSQTKEVEPRSKGREDAMSETIKSQEAVDKHAIELVEEDILDAKARDAEPKIPGDVASAGIKSPQVEAEKVLSDGPSIELPITQEEYETGNKEKINVKKDWTTLVYWGPKSLIGAVIRAGRLIKIAHTHAMKIVFRKTGKEVG